MTFEHGVVAEVGEELLGPGAEVEPGAAALDDGDHHVAHVRRVDREAEAAERKAVASLPNRWQFQRS